MPVILDQDTSLAWQDLGPPQVRVQDKKIFENLQLIFIISCLLGIGIATFEMNAIFILMLLGWVFVPVYMAAGDMKYRHLLFIF